MSSLAVAGYAPGWTGRTNLGPVDNATYLDCGTTILMCPSVPHPFVVEMVTSAAVNCIVSLLMLSFVGCPLILTISNALRALNTSCKIPMLVWFVQLPLNILVTIARQQQKRSMCVNRL